MGSPAPCAHSALLQRPHGGRALPPFAAGPPPRTAAVHRRLRLLHVVGPERPCLRVLCSKLERKRFHVERDRSRQPTADSELQNRGFQEHRKQEGKLERGPHLPTPVQTGDPGWPPGGIPPVGTGRGGADSEAFR